MDYKVESETFYKVVDGLELITFGKLEKGQIIATEKKIVWIDEDEFKKLSEKKKHI